MSLLTPVAFSDWSKLLLVHYGPDALLCVDSALSNEQLVQITNAAYCADTQTEEGKQAIAAYNGLWVMDLTGKEVVLARKIGWGFFALVIDHIPYTQPVTVEEPDPENPRENKPGAVGKIQALIAISPEGQVFVKTVQVARAVATGNGGPKLMELDRSSTSRGVKLDGTAVGVPSYINSARLRGSVQCLCAEAPEEAIMDPGWLPVDLYFRESPDIPGKAALITALVTEGLVGFGRV